MRLTRPTMSTISVTGTRSAALALLLVAAAGGADAAARPAGWMHPGPTQETGSPPAADPEARLDAARQALNAGRPQEALATLEALVEADPTSVPALTWLAHAQRLTGDHVAAARTYLRAMALSPDDPELLMGLGEIRETTGDFAAANDLYQRVIELTDGAAAAHRRAGAVQMQMRNHGRAATHFERYLEDFPEDVQTLHLLGLAHYFDQDLDAAVDALERALELQPEFIPAVYGLGVVLSDRPAEHDRALGLLRRAVEAEWEETEARYLIGRILLDQGDAAAALPWLESSIELAPDKIDAHYQLAQAYRSTGDRDAARSAMTRFEELRQAANRAEADEKQVKTLRNALADALNRGDASEVQGILDELLAAAPDDPEVLVAAAKVRFSLADGQGAAAAVDAALEADPRHWEALYLRGLLLSRARAWAAARNALERSLQGNPTFPDTHALLGNVLAAMDRLDEAVEAYRTAIELEPRDPGHYLNLATVHGRLGQEELEAEAMARYRSLLQLRSEEQ
ncbi:MAG: tetratricopeptide repeat protein [Acidobacteriota bacterium]